MGSTPTRPCNSSLLYQLTKVTFVVYFYFGYNFVHACTRPPGQPQPGPHICVRRRVQALCALGGHPRSSTVPPRSRGISTFLISPGTGRASAYASCLSPMQCSEPAADRGPLRLALCCWLLGELAATSFSVGYSPPPTPAPACLGVELAALPRLISLQAPDLSLLQGYF